MRQGEARQGKARQGKDEARYGMYLDTIFSNVNRRIAISGGHPVQYFVDSPRNYE